MHMDAGVCILCVVFIKMYKSKSDEMYTQVFLRQSLDLYVALF